MPNKLNRNQKFEHLAYVRRQVRDTLEGSNKVKSSGELYLPMPSSWIGAEAESTPSISKNVNSIVNDKIVASHIPWKHSNPIYQAYLQRSRFPDITANSLRAMIGTALIGEPKTELPDSMEILETEVSQDGESLMEFYIYALSEVLSAGKLAIVADVDERNNFYLTTYTAESNIDWKTRRSNGTEEVIMSSFLEDEEDEKDHSKFYFIDDLGIPFVEDYIDDVPIEGSLTELKYRGKNFTQLPIFFAGAAENTPDADKIPLLGISDIAISIYQKTADLNNAHFLTCNPTLFIFGASKEETPKVVGSNVIIGVRNPQGRAEYPATDTTALDHIQGIINDMFKEAASYGANFISDGAGRESGEALGIKQMGRGANLTQAVRHVGKAIEKALKFIAEMKSEPVDEVVFLPPTEFSKKTLNAQELTLLLSAVQQGNLTLDVFLDNLREAGHISDEKSNEDIKREIALSKPVLDFREQAEEIEEDDQ